MIIFDVSEIDTRIGTYNSHDFSNGNTIPVTCVPHGMNLFSIQTTHKNGNWWFNPYEPIYQGIKLTHQASPWIGDFNDLLITPITGNISSSDLSMRQSSFDTQSAIFSPNFLSITSNRFQLKTELVPSTYGANLKVESNHNQPITLIFTSNEFSEYEILNCNTLRFKTVHFDNSKKKSSTLFGIIKFNQNIDKYKEIQSNNSNNKLSGFDIHLQINFLNTEINCKLATSFISNEQALLNLNNLLDFDSLLSNTTSQWNNLLNKISIEESDQDKIQLFYHCLYRCLIFPQIGYEINKENLCIHFNHDSQTISEGKYFFNIGFWDAFRSLLPLLTIIYPDYIEDILEGVLNHYNETKLLPKWLAPYERAIMPGTLVDGFIIDSCKKGFHKEKIKELFEAMKNTSQNINNSPNGRIGNMDYVNLGYIPESYLESVSHTLDYSYSDWCIGQMAILLNKKSESKYYLMRSKNYQNLFNVETGLLNPKNSQNQFLNKLDKFEWGKYYAECSTLQSTLCAYHDFKGIIKLLGGKKKFTDYLIRLCNEKPYFNCKNYGYEIHEMSEMAILPFGQLAISNQPSFHIPYLFQLSNKPEYTSYLIDNIRNEAFSNTFRGYPGDEDNGSLSAWYIFSCLGFFPICPGNNTYQLGNPAFKKIKIKQNKVLSHDITIITNQKSSAKRFINYVTCDGTKISELTHHQLTLSETINFHFSILP